MESGQPTKQGRTIEWLEAKWPQPRTCPVCQQVPNWDIIGPVATTTLEGRDVILDRYTPLMLASCSNCAYTLTFNAIQMGLFNEGNNDA